MRIISHRGNVFGPNLVTENRLDAIIAAITMQFDVEIDVRLIDEMFYLGHDAAQYPIELDDLCHYADRLWIHCKNLAALYRLSQQMMFHYFWHQNDDFTLTSKNIIWTYPGRPLTPNSVLVSLDKEIDISGCFGICTDYPQKLGDSYGSKNL